MSAAENLSAALESCYEAFADEPRPQRLHASPLRDVDEILRTLSAAPLRELSGDQIGPYSGWAITTVGSERDYRHFLPRILELAATDAVWIGSEPPVIAGKLISGDWRSWPAMQHRAVWQFFHAAFERSIELHPEDGWSSQNWLCGLARLEEPPSPLVKRWLASNSPNAALQLASFIGSEAKHLIRHGAVRGPFWDTVSDDAKATIGTLLLSDRAKGFLENAAASVSEEDRFLLIDAALCELSRQA